MFDAPCFRKLSRRACRKRETSVKNKNTNSWNAALGGELYEMTEIATNEKFPLTCEHPNQLWNILLDNLGKSGHPLTAEYSNLVLNMQFNRVNIYIYIYINLNLRWCLLTQ